MFIAGIVAAGVVGALAHDNYSDHNNHSNHSKYSDSSLVMDIKIKKEQLEQRKRNLEQMRSNIRSQFEDAIQELRFEPELEAEVKKIKFTEAVADNASVKNRLKEQIRKQLESELAEDKQKLAEISEAIAIINNYNFKNK